MQIRRQGKLLNLKAQVKAVLLEQLLGLPLGRERELLLEWVEWV
jgi:hypothetical protein